jgi:fluoroacetyl-CoA thioesterase
MKLVYKQGDLLQYSRIVTQNDIAAFESGTVHHVYSTFALTRDAEWSGRLFVLNMKEAHEEGIGTMISVVHKSPAFIGQEVTFIARFEEITEKGEIITSFEAFVGERLVASGKQGQRILPVSKLETLFQSLENNNRA